MLKLKEHERATFFSPSENWCLPASTLKTEEREFVVDSGASMHMISKMDLSKAEMDTLTKSCSPTMVITANGEVQTNGEATVHVKELDIFLTMKVLGDTPAVLSPGKLCDEHGCSYEWINGQKPHLIKNGIRTQCNTENFVPIVVPGLPASCSSSLPSSTSMTPSRQEIDHPKSSSSSSTSPPMTIESVERREREDLYHSDIPEWLQEFRQNLVDDRVPESRDSHATSSHELSLEPMRCEDLGKHSVYTHFPKRPKLRDLPENQNHKGPVQKTYWQSRTKCRKNVGLITADQKVLSEGCESRNNHRYAVVVQDLATQWTESYPCKTKTSQETPKELAKVLGAE